MVQPNRQMDYNEHLVYGCSSGFMVFCKTTLPGAQ